MAHHGLQIAVYLSRPATEVYRLGWCFIIIWKTYTTSEKIEQKNVILKQAYQIGY